jgi:hypothetical protein
MNKVKAQGFDCYLYYDNIENKKILLLGETHGLGFTNEKDIYNRILYLEKLYNSLGSKCLDFFMEFNVLNKKYGGLLRNSIKEFIDDEYGEDYIRTIDDLKIFEYQGLDSIAFYFLNKSKSDNNSNLRIHLCEIRKIIEDKDKIQSPFSSIKLSCSSELLTELFDISDHDFDVIFKMLISGKIENNSDVVLYNFLTTFKNHPDVENIINGQQSKICKKIDDNWCNLKNVEKWLTIYCNMISKRYEKMDSELGVKLKENLYNVYIENRNHVFGSDEKLDKFFSLVLIPLDVYLLTRLFTNFNDKQDNVYESCSNVVENAIVLTGSAHTFIYEKLFKLMFNKDPLIHETSISDDRILTLPDVFSL